MVAIGHIVVPWKGCHVLRAFPCCTPAVKGIVNYKSNIKFLIAWCLLLSCCWVVSTKQGYTVTTSLVLHWHSHIQLCRYKSRCLLISFKSPSVGPRSAIKRTARAKLESALLSSCYSTAVGWIISLESQLCDGVEEVHHIEAQLQEMPAFANMPRQCIGWALLIFFTSKVCMSVSHICIVVCCTVETSLPQLMYSWISNKIFSIH